MNPLDQEARRRRQAINSLDGLFERQRVRFAGRLDRIEAWGTERKAMLSRAIERERPSIEGAADDPIVESSDALDHVVDENDVLEEEKSNHAQFDTFIHRKSTTRLSQGELAMGQNAHTQNRPGPAPKYPSRPANANVPPPSPVAINGHVVPRS